MGHQQRDFQFLRICDSVPNLRVHHGWIRKSLPIYSLMLAETYVVIFYILENQLYYPGVFHNVTNSIH